MSPRLIAIAFSLLLLALSLGLGLKLLLAHAFMLSPWQRLGRFLAGMGAGIALFVLVGAFFFLPAGPVAQVSEGEAAGGPAAQEGGELVWHTSFDKAREIARQENKLILVDAWAVWCKPCKKLEETILKSDALKGALSRFVLVKLDTMDDANASFVEKHEIGDNLPWIGFFDADGKLSCGKALYGEEAALPFSSVAAFGSVLDTALTSAAPAGSREWLTDLEQGFARSRELGQPLLVDGWAVWCASCVKLKHETLVEARVEAELAGWVKVALDMDAPENEAVWDRFGIKGLPWVARFEPGESAQPTWVLTDFEEPPTFLARLQGKLEAGDSVADWLASKGLALTLLLVFLAGIAASLTPCAYPSYLLIFGFFSSGGEGGQKRSLGSGILLATTIVLGMAVSYSAAGIAAALGGGAVGRFMNNPWVMGAIALLFIGIGASSIGALPPMEFSGLKNALHTRQKSNLLWAFVFGLVMGMVVAPCVGPILIGILAYIAAAGNLALGILLMTTFAFGMGVLFFAMAIFSQTIRSRVRMGRWNELITIFFGIVFFAAALYYLKGVIPYERLFALFIV